MRKIQWPQNKLFAFTIIDDTDDAKLVDIKPVYDYLYKKGVLTTKTVWAYPPKDTFTGETLSDAKYRDFVSELNQKGFEIAFHGAGSGSFTREETIAAIEKMKELFGNYPLMHINHCNNADGIYWGKARFSRLFGSVYGFLKKRGKEAANFKGTDEDSPFFWGDVCKQRIRYIRNMVFNGLNVFKYDKNMPYREKSKDKYSNYWFSACYGINKSAFVRLLSRTNIDKLAKENGCAVVYTHFAFGFTDKNGNLDEDFKRCVDYLAAQNGWFVPATEVLDYLREKQGKDIYISPFSAFCMNMKWLFGRIFQRES